MPPAIAVIGASADRSKFGNKAVRAYQRLGYEVYPIHPKAAEIEGLTAYPTLAAVPRRDFERVSFYVPPAVGMQLMEEVAQKQVQEVWLNPGADSPELADKGRDLGLNVIIGCSIVDVGVSPVGV